MYYLFFDLETDGRPGKNGKFTNNQGIIDICWIVCDEELNIIKERQTMISDVCDKLYPGQSVYTLEDFQDGDEWEPIMKEFKKDMYTIHNNKGYILSHNLKFDVNSFLFSTYLKTQDRHLNNELRHIFWKRGRCTMREMTDVLKIPGQYGYKWPKLQEWYNKLWPQKQYIQTHKSLDDVRLLVKCFKKSRQLGLIK